MEDRNNDGRPDVWRQYDRHGQLTEVAVDTNFDGRSDVQEYYNGGVLVRRESDRNFDAQVDLIEEFDPQTHAEIESVADLDYDGRADVLVLFRDGRPVFAKHAPPLVAPMPRRAENTAHESLFMGRSGLDRLATLTDPFRGDTAVRGTPVAPVSPDDGVGLFASNGLPVTGIEVVDPFVSSTPLVTSHVQPAAFASSFPRSPRGPPLS